MLCSTHCRPCRAFFTSRCCPSSSGNRHSSAQLPARSHPLMQRIFTRGPTSRQQPRRLVCLARRDTKRIHKKQQSEKSDMVHSELIYFMFQMASPPTCYFSCTLNLRRSCSICLKHCMLKAISSASTQQNLWLQNLDTQLQRTLNMDDFDTAQEIRRRRKEIDEVVAEQLVSRGVGFACLEKSF